MDARFLLNEYRKQGFNPLPLRPGEKLPLAKSEVDFGSFATIGANCNVGLFAGSTNGLVIIDADDPRSRENVAARLKEMGLFEWTTIVLTPKRQGWHFWLRMPTKPAGAQAYYKLSAAVGGGEFRVNKPAYVVAPGSVIPQGEYAFVQGGIDCFSEQPAVTWKDMLWLAPDRMMQAGDVRREVIKDAPLPKPAWARYRPEPTVLKLFEYMRHPDKQGRVQRIEYKTGAPLQGQFFDTRSEAEQATITGLAWAGWDYDQVRNLFDLERPGHYTQVPDQTRYLVTAYNKAVQYLESRHEQKAGVRQ